MPSPLVVTSWWSNCLGLLCLQRLVEHSSGREIFVMQAGKSAEQMARFRKLMPAGVVELHYPEELPADDSRMREYLALTMMRDYAGAWNIDHDTFFQEDCEPWLTEADRWLTQAGVCLCIGEPRQGPGVTQPAYWLSPARWPSGLSSFDPIPFAKKTHVGRPDLHLHNGDLIQPEKDTLAQVRDELTERNLAATFPLTVPAAGEHPLPPFPSHTHLGGIHVYTGPVRSPEVYDWVRHTVTQFERFFASCPTEWLDAEEPELLRRHRQLKEALDNMSPEQQSFENFPRKYLQFKFSRRGLFGLAKQQYIVTEGESLGGVGFKLSQLGSLPDEELAHIAPRIVPECRISTGDGFIWGALPKSQPPIKLFTRDLDTLAAFNLMNGLTPLGEIGALLAQQLGWEEARAFAFARGLFLHLVKLRVSIPAGATT